jgi:hypothetical protein
MTMSAGMLERDAEMRRRRLSHSLDELTERLTPGSVIDEVLSYTRAGGGDFLKGLGKSAAANPIPTLLIGVGCMMFLSGRTGLTAGRTGSQVPLGSTAPHGAGLLASIRDMLGGAASTLKAGASSAKEAARSGVRQVGPIAFQATGAVTQGAADLGQTAASLAGRAAGAIGDVASSSLNAAGEYAGMATDTVASAAASAEQSGFDLVQGVTKLSREQPLVVAAAGLAIGAVIAAMLPKTGMEDSLMGETSDAVKLTVGQVAAEGAGAATDALGNVADKVVRAAEDAGLSPSIAAEALETLGDRVAGVANAGLDAAKEEADRLLKQRIN